MDYRASHLDPTKARSYDESFARYPYRRIVWEWEKEILREIAQDLSRNKPGFKYLDFACGTGRILRLLESYATEAYGVDVSEPMLQVAKENVQHSNLLLCDLTEEDVFPIDYFDLITAFRFFLNAQQALKESALKVFGKILRKDGHIILNIHMNKGCLLEKELRAYQLLKRIHDPNFHSMSVRETKSLLHDFNFEVVQTFHYGVFPVYREEHKTFINQIDYLERLGSRFPYLLHPSRFVIYVCRLNSSKKFENQ